MGNAIDLVVRVLPWLAVVGLLAYLCSLYWKDRFAIRRARARKSMFGDSQQLPSRSEFAGLTAHTLDTTMGDDVPGLNLQRVPDYAPRSHLLGRQHMFLYRLLRVALPEYEVFCRVRMTDIVKVVPDMERHLRMRSYRRIAHLYVDAVLCAKDMSIVAVVDLQRRDEKGQRRAAIESFKTACLARAPFTYILIDPNKMPRYKMLREMVMQGVPDPTDDATPTFVRSRFLTLAIVSKMAFAKTTFQPRDRKTARAPQGI